MSNPGKRCRCRADSPLSTAYKLPVILQPVPQAPVQNASRRANSLFSHNLYRELPFTENDVVQTTCFSATCTAAGEETVQTARFPLTCTANCYLVGAVRYKLLDYPQLVHRAGVRWDWSGANSPFSCNLYSELTFAGNGAVQTARFPATCIIPKATSPRANPKSTSPWASGHNGASEIGPPAPPAIDDADGPNAG